MLIPENPISDKLGFNFFNGQKNQSIGFLKVYFFLMSVECETTGIFITKNVIIDVVKAAKCISVSNCFGNNMSSTRRVRNWEVKGFWYKMDAPGGLSKLEKLREAIKCLRNISCSYQRLIY